MTVPAWLGSLMCISHNKTTSTDTDNKASARREKHINRFRQRVSSSGRPRQQQQQQQRHRQSDISFGACPRKGVDDEEDEEEVPVRIVRTNSNSARRRRSISSSPHLQHLHHLHPRYRRPRSAPVPPLPPPASARRFSFSPAPWELDAMDAATVAEVIHCLGRLFHHVPYAVCGTAALVYYGYDSYYPDHVSITCPEESKEAIRCWAVAQGMTLSPNNPDGFSVRTADGRFCAVCIKFMKSGFEALHRVRVGAAQTSIVTLPSIANTIARSYVFRLHNASTERQALYARYLSWTLRRIAQVFASSPEQRLTPERARDIVDRAFWVPFTLSYPDTVPLFEAAGLVLVDMQADDNNNNNAPREWRPLDGGREEALMPPQRRSSHRFSFNLDSDYESENTPSLRRVTKRLPGTRPLLSSSTFSSPSNSDSEFSPHSANASPQFVLASHPSSFTIPTRPVPSRMPTTNASPQQPSRRRVTRAEEPRLWI